MMHVVKLDGLPVATFESKDMAELGKLILGSNNHGARSISVELGKVI